MPALSCTETELGHIPALPQYTHHQPHPAAWGIHHMKIRTFTSTLSALALAVASFTASADILFQNLGTAAPPASVAGFTMTPFDQGTQAAIANGTNVSSIPGGPNGTSIGISPVSSKGTVGVTWGTWSHGYTGAMYYSNGSTQATLTLPANTAAFYFYVNPNPFAFHAVTATTSTGETSEAIQVSGNGGANGFAFYSTAGETITSITVTSTADFAVGEFGINAGSATTCASEGYTGTKLNWCKIICESESSSSTIDTYLRRWINKYRDLPYCAVEGGGEEPPPQEG